VGQLTIALLQQGLQVFQGAGVGRQEAQVHALDDARWLATRVGSAIEVILDLESNLKV